MPNTQQRKAVVIAFAAGLLLGTVSVTTGLAGDITVTAGSMTDYGPLSGYLGAPTIAPNGQIGVQRVQACVLRKHWMCYVVGGGCTGGVTVHCPSPGIPIRIGDSYYCQTRVCR